MKIAVIGAAGNVGSRIVAEALRRRHQVTALDAADLDATDTTAVTAALQGHDVGVGATRPAPGHESEAVAVTWSLLQGHSAAGVRFVMIGGAGSLYTRENRYVADDPHWVPASIQPLARTAIDQLDACRDHPAADWTYISPSALMEPGPRTGNYRVGADHLLIDTDGNSYLSMEDMAVAVLDEIEQPTQRRQRLTIATNLNRSSTDASPGAD